MKPSQEEFTLPSIYLFIAFTLSYSVLYAAALLGLSKHPFSKRDEVANRISSTAHALYQVSNCISFFRFVASGFYSSRTLDIYSNPPQVHFFLLPTLSYMCFDLIRMILYFFCTMSSKKPVINPSMVLHHLIIIGAYVFGQVYAYGTLFMGLFIFNEMTTPFLNSRMILGEFDLKSHPAYQFSTYLFALAFTFCRFVYNFFVIGKMVLSLQSLQSLQGKTPPYHVPVAVTYYLPTCAFAHVLVNLYWYGYILRMVYRKIQGTKEKLL
jgi:hypothetical protein